MRVYASAWTSGTANITFIASVGVAASILTGSIPAGANAIGKLAANSGVDIGDVDVTSIVPGVAATNLGKAEDAAHTSGDTGVMALAVRQDTLSVLSADGDYIPLVVDGNGKLYTAGYNSAEDAVDANIVNAASQQSVTVEIQSASTIDAAETQLGGEIDCLGYNTITFFYDYTKGDETGVYLYVYALRVTGGDEHQYNYKYESPAGTLLTRATRLYETASIKSTWTIDVKGINILVIKDDANAGTPTGTLQIGYTLTNN
jgi:hypothetical protein